MHQLLKLVLPDDDLQKLNKVSCAVAIEQPDVKKIKIEKYQGTFSEIYKKYWVIDYNIIIGKMVH